MFLLELVTPEIVAAAVAFFGTHFSASALSTIMKSHVLNGNPVVNWIRRLVNLLALNVNKARPEDYDGKSDKSTLRKGYNLARRTFADAKSDLQAKIKGLEVEVAALKIENDKLERLSDDRVVAYTKAENTIEEYAASYAALHEKYVNAMLEIKTLKKPKPKTVRKKKVVKR